LLGGMDGAVRRSGHTKRAAEQAERYGDFTPASFPTANG
jgi:hypothetical protein